MDITVAIDAMGGDHGPHVTIPAALKALEADSARKLWNEFFASAPQLKRDPLGSGT